MDPQYDTFIISHNVYYVKYNVAFKIDPFGLPAVIQQV
jgi:hypothetical protein